MWDLPHMSRIKQMKRKSEQKIKRSKIWKKKKKGVRKEEDGLLLVVSIRIYGRTVKALIDSGAVAYDWEIFLSKLLHKSSHQTLGWLR